MKCNNCGTEFDEGIFCPECGTKFEAGETVRIENERLALEKRMNEEESKRAEESKKQEELRRQEQKEVRELELEKIRVEQERLAKERVEQEAEVLRLKKEEAERKAAEDERLKAEQLAKEERLSRTFNGTEYQTIEEAKAASIAYDIEQEEAKKQKKIDGYAIWSLICGIALWPLTMIIIGQFLTIPAVIFGVKALKNNTSKRGCAIGGIVSVAIYVVVIIIGIISVFM